VSRLLRWLPSLAILIALFGVGLTAVLVRATWHDALREHEQLFEVRSEAVREQLLLRIKATDEMVSGLATFINSAAHVDADQFRLFSEELLSRHPYLLSTAYLPRVRLDERSDFEHSRREAGFPRFAVTDRLGADFRTSPTRVQYFPLLYIEPFEPTSVVMIGFDVLSDPRLASAARAAIDTATPRVTAPASTQTGVSAYWLFVASYGGKLAPKTAAERRAGVNGLVALRVDGARLLAEALASRTLAARLRMIPAESALAVDVAASTSADGGAGSSAVTVFTRSAEVGTGHQRFMLELSEPIAWGDMNHLPAMAVLVTGLLATAMLSIAAWRTARRTVQLEQKNIEVEQRVAEKTAELALEKERAQVTLASIGDAVITTDAAGRVEYLNMVAERLTGWGGDAARGRKLAEVFRVQPAGSAQGSTGKPAAPARESLLFSRTEAEIAIDQSVAPIFGREGEVLGSVVVFHDVSAQRQLAQEMAYQASHDALTGLLNRRAFEDRLAQLLASAKTDGTRHALLYLDLDQFKIVNDACGHSAGDQLLRQLSAQLRKESRQSDALARLGGDEFGVLLPHCPLNEAEKLAQKLLRNINDFRFVYNERAFAVGASIGLVPFDGESDSATSMLSAADAACYAAKDKGRNRVMVYQADDVELSQRRTQMQWVTRLRQALDEDRFVLYGQPIVPVRSVSAKPAHYEVLLRLREHGTLVPPGAFLPAAERYGLMPEIDRWVVRRTLGWLTRHAGDPGLAANYSINLSGQSLSDAPFLEFVLREIERSGVAPARVSFEITETAAVTVSQHALQLMQTLRQRGCRFLLDDFGSGWSSFAYLKNLPVDFLKIDGSLVRDMAHDILDEAMVRAINEIGHVLGIATIAEFVENEAILERLTALGVDYAQGYAIGRPAPIDAHLESSPPTSVREFA
jgi:diguanylate cyclase (GGDEF)-like protein/PAS domain S-box-containing protein